MQQEATSNVHERPELNKLIHLQLYIRQGDYESFEQELPDTKHPGLQKTLNDALIYTIRFARSSTDYFQGVQMLFSKGADLNAEDDGKN